jgi:phospholipid transport system transporter-binding protein
MMTKPEIVPGDGSYRVTGDLVFATVTPLLALGEALFSDNSEIVFDFRETGRSDSAGLALLLEWMDRANSRGVDLRYRNLPESLLAVAHLSNVDELIRASGD